MRKRVRQPRDKKLDRLVSDLGGMQEVDAILGNAKRGEQIPEAFLEKFFLAVGQHRSVLQVLTSLSGDIAIGFSTISDLLSKGVVKPTHELWPDLPISPEVVFRDASEWTKKISELRQDPKRYVSSAIDGQALAYLKLANEVFKEERRVILLVSHSRTLLDAARDLEVRIPMTRGEDLTMPCVLSPTWVSVYLAHHCAMRDSTHEMLTKTHDELMELIDSQTCSENRSLKARARGWARREIQLARRTANSMGDSLLEKLRSVENLALASQASRYIEVLERPLAQRDEEIVRILHSLVEVCASPQVSEKVVAEAHRRLESIPKLVDSIQTAYELPDLGLRQLGQMTAERFPAVARKALRKVVVKGLSGLFLYSVQFRSTEAQTSATEIVELITRKRFYTAYEKLLGALAPSDAQAEAEAYLLIGYFLALLGEYDPAIEVLDRGCNLRDGAIAELLFLKAVLHRLLGQYESGVVACRSAIDSKREWALDNDLLRVEDPRYCNELGVLLNAAAGVVEDRDQQLELLNDALAALEKVLELTENDSELIVRSLNNSAYIQLEIARITNLETALDSARQANRAMLSYHRNNTPRSIWHAEYTDTRLWITYMYWSRRNKMGRRLLRFIRAGYSKLNVKESRDPAFESAVSQHRAIVESAWSNLCNQKNE